MSANLKAAMKYAESGIRVFPVFEIKSDGRCACVKQKCGNRKGKHPRVAGGFKSATTDGATIRNWWGRWPHANIATPTGGELLVVDIDPRNGGTESFVRLETELGALPKDRSIKSGSGGPHHYVKVPHGAKFALDKVAYPGIDLKHDGGYVLLPPSNHASGGSYEWIAQGDAPSLPDQWLAFLMPTAKPARQSSEQSEGAEVTIERATEYLGYLIDARCDNRGDWLSVGMALHHEDDSDEMCEVWDRWSQRSDKYKPGECSELWSGFDSSRDVKVTFGTIVYWAMEDLRDQNNGNEFDATTGSTPIEDGDEDGDGHDDPPGIIPIELVERAGGYLTTRVEHMNECAQYPTPRLNLCAAVIELCIAASRKFIDSDGTALVLSIYGLAPSGRGKNHSRTNLFRILHKAGLFHRVGTKLTGVASLQDGLKRDPTYLLAPDEASKLISQMADPKNGNISELTPEMNTLLTNATNPYVCRDKAATNNSNGKGAVIDKPHFCFFGICPAEAFYRALNVELAEEGWLGRTLPVEEEPRKRRVKNRKPFSIPDDHVAFLLGLYHINPENNGIRNPIDSDEAFLASLGQCPDLYEVPRSTEGQAACDAFRDEMDDAYIAAEKMADRVGAASYARAGEHVNVLALVRAVSRLYDKYRPGIESLEPEWWKYCLEIEKEDIEWAIEVASHVLKLKLYKVRHRRPETEFTANRRTVTNVMRGKAKISERKILDNSHLDRRVVRAVLETMEAAGQVKKYVPTKGTKATTLNTHYELSGNIDT